MFAKKSAIQSALQENSNVVCLSIGATYLQEKYMSEARGTNDIDFVVFSQNNMDESELLELVIKRLRALNYQKYTDSRNPLVFKDATGVTLHIYVQSIGDFEVSDTMKQRVNTNKSLAVEDYVVLKLFPSDREKDVDDIVFILQKNPNIDWKIILTELREQLENYKKKFGLNSTVGKTIAFGAILEQIRDEHPDLITLEIMESMKELYRYFESQMR